MSYTFTKLFSSITESSIWVAPDAHRLVWITLLAMADRQGRVWASVPGLANRARVSVVETEAAIAAFLAPDPYSRTKTAEGRRLEEIDGGWRLITYKKHRELRDEETVLESKRRYINARRARERPNRPSVSSPLRDRPMLSDTDWLAQLKADPTYTDLDIEREFGKCRQWCLTRRKAPPSRRRLVNWLNQAEKPQAPTPSPEGTNGTDHMPHVWLCGRCNEVHDAPSKHHPSYHQCTKTPPV